MTSELNEKSRRRGAAIEYEAPGVYHVSGPRGLGVTMVLEAIDEAVKEWCQRVNENP